MNKKTAWYLVGLLTVVLALTAVACGGAPAETPPATPPATPVTPPTTPVTPPPAPPVTPPPATPVTGPPKAPKALHESLFAATPACTGCHTVGAAGVGAAGGTGLPGPGSASDHTGRTSDTCKSCHQLSS